MTYLLALDQGTTSTRAIVFREDLTIAAMAQEEFAQHYPHPGWVEHDCEDLWRTSVSTMRAALENAGATAAEVAAIGLTNQRETTIVWTGKPARPSRRRSSGRTGAPARPARG